MLSKVLLTEGNTCSRIVSQRRREGDKGGAPEASDVEYIDPGLLRSKGGGVSTFGIVSSSTGEVTIGFSVHPPVSAKGSSSVSKIEPSGSIVPVRLELEVSADESLLSFLRASKEKRRRGAGLPPEGFLE